MNKEQLFDGITDIRDDLITEAGTHVFQNSKKFRWRRWAAAAAAVVAVAGLGAYGLSQFRMGGSTPGGNASGDGGNGSGDGTTYMSYAGPVFPLTALGGAAGITAERRTDYDFSPYESTEYTWEYEGKTYANARHRSEAVVTDGYTLTNAADADKKLSLLYPVALKFSSPTDRLPAIAVDGAGVSPTVCAGPYSGGYTDTRGQAGGERMNLMSINSWEGYKALLSDGRYAEDALGEFPVLDRKVTVYKIDDYVVAPTDAVNPSLQISFTIDYDKTTVLTYGANGMSRDLETGWNGFIVGGLADRYREAKPMYILLLGEDIDGYELQGYANMGGDAGTEIDVDATVTRYETTLEAMLRQFVTDSKETALAYLGTDEGMPLYAVIDPELLYGCTAELLVTDGILSDNPAERYDYGRLEEILYETRFMDRVLYLAFNVTIPAGESVEVTAKMVKSASYDHYGAGGKEPYRHGFDLVTRLGSTLDFTAQYASVSGTEYIRLLDNNFGFDPDAGITEAVLDPAQEHYWMQIRKATDEERMSR